MTAPDLSKQTDHGRFYVHPRNRKAVPSITNVIGMKAKPGIAYWGYKQCGIFVSENWEMVTELARKDPSAVVDLVKGAPNRSTSKSGDRGDLVHEWIERRIHSQGKEPTTEEIEQNPDRTARSMWASFLRVEARYEPEWLLAETTVWSDQHDYAGTIDWVARIGGKVTMGDTKTGNNVYPEVGLQVAAGANADYGIDQDGRPFVLPEIERFAVLHIRPRYARLSPLDNMEENFKAFLGLRAIFEWDTIHAENVIGYAPKIES
jgi:hypothetical protein